MCHENNWLFKILFKEYLKNEKEYKKNYQTILLTQLVRSTSLHHLGSQKTMVMSTSFGVLCTACQVLPVPGIRPWAPISNPKDVSLWVLSAACGARRSMAIHSSLRHTLTTLSLHAPTVMRWTHSAQNFWLGLTVHTKVPYTLTLAVKWNATSPQDRKSVV